MTHSINIILLTGLPGSGKTMYLKQSLPNKENSIIYSLDNYLDPETRELDYEQVKDALQYAYPTPKTSLVFDGFLPTIAKRLEFIQKAIIDVVVMQYLKSWSYMARNDEKFIFKITEYYWQANRQACLFNDQFRTRARKSTSTIKNSPYDGPLTLEKLSTIDTHEFAVQLELDTVYKTVETYSVADSIWTPIVLNNGEVTTHNGKQKSKIVSPWIDQEDFINREFFELDEVLEKIDPNMSLFKYKTIKRLANVQIENSSECRDYYSSERTYIYRYTVEFEQLKKAIAECGYDIGTNGYELAS